MNLNRDGSKENPFNTVSEAMLYAGKFYGLYVKDLIIKFLEDYNDPYELITLQHQPFHSLQINGEGFNVVLPSIRQYVGRVFIFNCTIELRSNQNYGVRAYNHSYLGIFDCTVDCKSFGKIPNAIFRVGDRSVMNLYNLNIKNYISDYATSIFYSLNTGLMYLTQNFNFENMTGNIANFIYMQGIGRLITDTTVKFTGDPINTLKYRVLEASILNLNGVGESIFDIATQAGTKDETSIIC